MMLLTFLLILVSAFLMLSERRREDVLFYLAPITLALVTFTLMMFLGVMIGAMTNVNGASKILGEYLRPVLSQRYLAAADGDNLLLYGSAALTVPIILFIDLSFGVMKLAFSFKMLPVTIAYVLWTLCMAAVSIAMAPVVEERRNRRRAQKASDNASDDSVGPMTLGDIFRMQDERDAELAKAPRSRPLSETPARVGYGDLEPDQPSPRVPTVKNKYPPPVKY